MEVLLFMFTVEFKYNFQAGTAILTYIFAVWY